MIDKLKSFFFSMRFVWLIAGFLFIWPLFTLAIMLIDKGGILAANGVLMIFWIIGLSYCIVKFAMSSNRTSKAVIQEEEPLE